jgi:enediyne biosynthesis protein E4
VMDGPPAILLNESEGGRWIRLDLIGRESNRSAIGAAVEIHTPSGVIHRQVKGGGNYLGANDPRLLIGLGRADRVDRVEVRWPGGARTTLRGPELERTHIVREGAGRGDTGGADAPEGGAP